VTDLERLFQQLVATLAATDPARLNRPVVLGDIRDSILPYRTSRRALGLDTVEDYDLLLLRLAAGDGGFARTSPEPVRARFVAEIAGSNPDLGLLRHHSDAALTLEGLRVARALAASDEDRYAPPEPEPEPDTVLDLEVARPARHTVEPVPPPEPGPMCLFCGGTLPSGRTVNFCPSCGQSQITPRCPQCQTEVELGWRHCVNCGAALAQV
jgi:predicted RNA-binding Zn-ribbon protein involved in translation (DUF1610 family)